MKTNNGDMQMVPAHIEDDDLVAYLDGERDAEMQRATQAHLESCWYCRSRLSSVQRSIENFLQLRQNELLPSEIPPAGSALDIFRARLNAHRTLSPSHSFIKQYIPDARTLFRRISQGLSFSNYSLRTQVLATRALAAVVMTSMVVGFILMSGRYNTVSATELLRLSIEAQNERINQVDQPVLHQRLQVRAGNHNQGIDVWEIWNDTVNARVRTRSGGESFRESSMVADLRSILRSNHMNEHLALSAASYKSWSDSLVSKSEEVSKDTDAAGKTVLTIKTIPNDPVVPGGIASATLSIRENDYHPIALSFQAMTTAGEQEFELVEQDFQIVSLNNIDPAIFADPTKVEIASTVGTTPRQAPSLQQPAAGTTVPAAESNGNSKFSVATAAVEVEVLELLHKVGADVTEQISVMRTADGVLVVEGLVETGQRKNEILAALSPVRQNPAIRIKIQTIEEAARALKRQKEQATPGIVDRIEVEKGALPAEGELRQYFANRGGDTDAQIRQFASRALNRSQAAAFQASALNRMVNRFNAAQLAELDPAARGKWLGILKGYAAAVRRETGLLRSELQPVFGGFEAGGGESIASDADLIATALRLYEAASANDRAVRSAFTLSISGGSVSAVRSAQFRRSVALAEALAAAIERAK